MTTHRVQGNIRPRRSGSVSVLAAVGLVLLLMVPALAFSRLAVSVDWRLLGAVALGLSLLTFLAYRSDKRRAEVGAWRIPESTLHLAELIGGWPGAFLAQRAFRHKISKTSYQIEFWGIVLFHQFLAFDSLAGWKFSKEALHLIKTHMG